MTTVVMKTTARVVVPIVLVVAVELFVQGHNLPGGGFIAGVLTAAAFVLVYLAYGLEYLEEGVLGREVEQETGIFDIRTVTAYRRLFVFGLVVAIGSGFAALLFEEPFLSQTFTHTPALPIYGEVELASALVFEVGVFCVVVGGLLTIISVVGAE